MKTYVDKVEKPDGHPLNALRRTPRRSGKNGNLNRRGMSNNNKTCFRCGGIYPHDAVVSNLMMWWCLSS